MLHCLGNIKCTDLLRAENCTKRKAHWELFAWPDGELSANTNLHHHSQYEGKGWSSVVELMLGTWGGGSQSPASSLKGSQVDVKIIAGYPGKPLPVWLDSTRPDGLIQPKAASYGQEGLSELLVCPWQLPGHCSGLKGSQGHDGTYSATWYHSPPPPHQSTLLVLEPEMHACVGSPAELGGCPFSTPGGVETYGPQAGLSHPTTNWERGTSSTSHLGLASSDPWNQWRAFHRLRLSQLALYCNAFP